MWVCGCFARVVKREVAIAKGYRVANDIILSGTIVVLCQVYALAPPREGANVRLNYEGGAVVELRRMRELKR